MRFVFALAALLCAAAVYAAEPPVIQSEPPAIVSQCECVTGGECTCGPDCGCSVPVIAPLPYDADHTCNRCGTFANVVERELPGGMHSHRCGSCGHEWYHADPGVTLPSVQYTIAPPSNPFATGDCANGNCARASAPRIVGTASVVRSVYGVSRTRVFEGSGWHPGKLLGRVFGRLRGVRGGCN